MKTEMLTLSNCVTAAEVAIRLLVPINDKPYDTQYLMSQLQVNEEMARAIQHYGIQLFFAEVRRARGEPDLLPPPEA